MKIPNWMQRIGGWLMRIIGINLLLLSASYAQAAPHSVTLNWVAPTVTPAPTGYNVYKFAGACGPALTQFTRLNTAPVTVLTFTDSGLADGVTACYQITAIYAAGESGSSGALQITTPTFTATAVLTPPGPPSASVQ